MNEYVVVLHAPDGYTDWQEARGYPTADAARAYALLTLERSNYWRSYSIYQRFETGPEDAS